MQLNGTSKIKENSILVFFTENESFTTQESDNSMFFPDNLENLLYNFLFNIAK